MNKNEVIEILKNIEIADKRLIQDYLIKINNISEGALQNILKQNNIQSEEDLKSYVKNNMDAQNKFIELNDFVSYGKSKDTIHIHVVPKDARFLLNRNGLNIAEYKLIEALEKLQEITKNDESLKNIKEIYAVSGLIKKPISTIFENLEFDVKSMKIDDAKNDEELKKFHERFKDKKNLGRARLSKEKLFSKEWNKLKDDRKSELKFKLKLDEVNELARYSVIEEMGKNLEEQVQNKENPVIEQ